jgi:hypothetical protein
LLTHGFSYAENNLGVHYLGRFVGSVYLALTAFGLTPFACLTETRQRISDLSDFSFEISETSCDTLAKDDAISVFATRPGHTEKVLLLKYDPGPDVLPTIRVTPSHEISIAISAVSSIFSQRDELDGFPIRYDIGVVRYPTQIEHSKSPP